VVYTSVTVSLTRSPPPGGPPVEEPPNVPKKPPVKEPDEPYEKPPVPEKPPVDEPWDVPPQTPVEEPPPEDPSLNSVEYETASIEKGADYFLSKENSAGLRLIDVIHDTIRRNSRS
jgi:hypothetical protein